MRPQGEFAQFAVEPGGGPLYDDLLAGAVPAVWPRGRRYEPTLAVQRNWVI